jgi:uncharacterized BrkB/YihY/UPF0761 family membrane protein
MPADEQEQGVRMTEEEPGQPVETVETGKTWSERARARARQLEAWVLENRPRHASIDASFQIAERDQRIAASVLAGGIAFRLFLWLLPLALILGGVIGFVPRAAKDAAEEVGLTEAAVDSVATAAEQAESGRWVLLLVGAWLLLWTGYTSVRALRLVHALAWGMRPPRGGSPLKASLVFSGACLLLLAVPGIAAWLREASGGVGLATTLLSIAAFFAVWLWGSWQLPHRDAPWRALVPGAIFFAVGVQAMHLFIALYVAHKLERASALYGGLGLAATFLFVLYLGGRLIVASAILNSTLWERKQAELGLEVGAPAPYELLAEEASDPPPSPRAPG